MTIATPNNPMLLSDGNTAFAGTAYGQVNGNTVTLDTTAAKFDGTFVGNISSVKTSAGNETYIANITSSNDPNFGNGSPIQTLGVQQFNAIGQILIPFSTLFAQTQYRYVRLQVTEGGTNPTCNMQAFVLPYSALDELSLSQLILQFGLILDTEINVSQQLLAWLTGTATGGPNNNGMYPLTNYVGQTIMVPCIALIVAQAKAGANVVSYGAVGDGVTDDTKALQAAIDAASAAVNSSNAQGGGIVRIPQGLMLRITAPVYLEKGVVIEGAMGVGAFFSDFTPGQITGSGIFADFDFSSGGAIESVGFVSATGARISTTQYIKGADVDAGTYTHNSGTGLRNLFIQTNHATAFCPIRFVGAPQWTLDNVYCHGFWHGPIANASWVGSVPRLFSRCLYSGLIVDQDCNGCSFGSLYLSGDLIGPTATGNEIPAGRQFPNWDPTGLANPADPNTQPTNANMKRTGLVVMAGDPASAQVVICEAWNVAAVVHSSGLSCQVFECENITEWLFTVYASRMVIENLFVYAPTLNIAYGCVGADVKIGIPEWVAGYFASPIQFWSNYANAYVIEGNRNANYPYLPQVTYRQAEDNQYNDMYIDINAGNDTWVGCTAAYPLQTFLEALFRCRTDKINRIFFQQGQTIQTILPGSQFHENGAVLEDSLVSNCTLEFHNYQPASGAAARPILEAVPDGTSVHTNGIIIDNVKLLFQDVDYLIRVCTNTPEGYNAGLYVQGTCDVRFKGASTISIEASATVQTGLFQPFYARSGFLTWSLEDSTSIVQYAGSGGKSALGVSSYQGLGQLAVKSGVNTTASTPIDANILANGYVGTSYYTSFLAMSGLWNGPHLVIGAFHIWDDQLGGYGSLRMKLGAPTSATDGTPFLGS